MCSSLQKGYSYVKVYSSSYLLVCYCLFADVVGYTKLTAFFVLLNHFLYTVLLYINNFLFLVTSVVTHFCK